MKYLGIILIGIIAMFGVAVLGSAMNLITIPWLKFDRQVQMNRDIVTKTYDADNALYNYHWFQEKAGEIKTASQNIDVASSSLNLFEVNSGPRSSWTFEDKTESARLRAVLQGTISYYNGLVNEYDARAKEVDRNIFQNNLPMFFNLRPY